MVCPHKVLFDALNILRYLKVVSNQDWTASPYEHKFKLKFPSPPSFGLDEELDLLLDDRMVVWWVSSYL